MRSRFPLLIALTIVCAGCSRSTEDRLVGIWSIDRKGTQIPDFPIPNVAERIRDMTRNTRLKLLSDRKFVLNYTGSIEGSWALENGDLILTPKKGGNFMMSDGPIRAKIGEDFRSLSFTQEAVGQTAVLKLRKTG